MRFSAYLRMAGLLVGAGQAVAATFSFVRQDVSAPDVPSAGSPLWRVNPNSFGHNIAVGDFDGKNGPDVAVSAVTFNDPTPPQQRVRIEVFLNRGDGTLAPPVSGIDACTSPTANSDIGLGPIATANVNGDAFDDLVVGCNGQLVALTGGPSGLEASVIHAVPLATPLDVFVARFVPGSADRQIMYLDGSTGRLCVVAFSAFPGTGDGCLDFTSGVGTLASPRNAVGDLNPSGGCGADEIVGLGNAGNNPPYNVGIFGLNDGDVPVCGSVTWSTRSVSPTIPVQYQFPRGFAIGDVTGDGAADVVVGSSVVYDASAIAVQPWVPGLGIPANQQPVVTDATSSLDDIALADFDGDGTLDIATSTGPDNANTHGPLLSVQRGLGNGAFLAPDDFPVRDALQGTGNSDLVVADFDRDGRPDVALTSESAEGVSVMLNRPPGVTTTTTTLPPTPCQSVASCLTALKASLPNPAGSASKKSRRIAAKLQHRYEVLSKILMRAAASTGKKQTNLYTRSRTNLHALMGAAQKAATRGTLDVPLPPLQAAVDALLAQLP